MHQHAVVGGQVGVVPGVADGQQLEADVVRAGLAGFAEDCRWVQVREGGWSGPGGAGRERR